MSTVVLVNDEAYVLIRAEEVARRLSVSRAAVYKLLATGALPSVRVGKSRRVRLADLSSYVASLEPNDASLVLPSGG